MTEVVTNFKQPAGFDAVTKPKRGKGLHAMSKKRQRENRVRAALRAEVLSRGCEICPVLFDHMPEWECCDGTAVDWHEVLTRARGGSITDPDNGMAACRLAHDFVTTHPEAADAWELTRRRTPEEIEAAAAGLREGEQG